jgi:hypothetical protein
MHKIIGWYEFMGILIFPDIQNAKIAKIIPPYTIMIRKLLLTVIVFASASDVVLAGQNFAMLPFGSDANRHFYKDQEWLWNDQKQPAQPAQQSDPRAFTFTMPTHPPQVGLAFTMPTHPPQAGLAFTMPTHPPQAGLAFTMPTHPPQAELAFTMPTHPPQAGLAFTMPTHPPQAGLAFTMPTHPPQQLALA